MNAISNYNLPKKSLATRVMRLQLVIHFWELIYSPQRKYLA
ncbi:hypothetical protein OROHE_009015 [Orobanche hederae]